MKDPRSYGIVYTTTYQATIWHWEFDTDKVEGLIEANLEWDSRDVQIEFWHGTPASLPFIEIKSGTRSLVEEATKQVVAIMLEAGIKVGA